MKSTIKIIKKFSSKFKSTVPVEKKENNGTTLVPTKKIGSKTQGNPVYFTHVHLTHLWVSPGCRMTAGGAEPLQLAVPHCAAAADCPGTDHY